VRDENGVVVTMAMLILLACSLGAATSPAATSSGTRHAQPSELDRTAYAPRREGAATPRDFRGSRLGAAHEEGGQFALTAAR